MRRIAATAAALWLLAATAQAHTERRPAPMPALDAPCPGTAITPDRVIQGTFTTQHRGSHVMVPFSVPDGTTAVRVKYCYDQPDSPTSAQVKHTIDLGLYEPPAVSGGTWGPRELRGWGGSSHPDVTVSPQGFAKYGEQSPGRTTRAFRPAPIRDGRWAIELGVAAVVGQDLGDSDGAVNWRVEIELADNPAYDDDPYTPAAYDPAPAKEEAGWYAGDMHVHGEHSALADAQMTEVVDYAFGEAGLDFITLSDYVGGAQWDEIGRIQSRHPDKLVVRSAEVISYRGHANNHASATTVDHRTGPVLLRREPDGALEPLRPAQPGSRILQDIRAAGGVTQLNHVTIFPNEVPGFALLCRGCEWNYSGEETDWSLVDAIEVATGPAGLQDLPGHLGPNPFTATAIDFYERALASNRRIAAVGSSDSHNAGRRNNPVTQSPIGQATTVVHAPELSEAGIACGIEAGHTFVKVWSAKAPDLRLEGRIPGSDAVAIFGDTVRSSEVAFTARVLGAAPPPDGLPYTLLVVKDGNVISMHGMDSGEETIAFGASGPGRYGLRLMRGSSVEGVSTPIWVEEPGAMTAPGVVSQPCTRTQAAARAAKRLAERRLAAKRRAAKLRAAVKRACSKKRLRRGNARQRAAAKKRCRRARARLRRG